MFIESQTLSEVSFIANMPSVSPFGAAAETGGRVDGFTIWPIISAFILVVSIGLVIRLLIQLLSIEKIKAKATLLQAGEVNIYNLPDRVLPFSFFDSIYINTAEYTQDELPEIIEHERVHVQQKHTIDVLITELICVFNWYNPFAWLLRKAVRENLEFIADDAVISKGIDKKSYQYLLLKVTGDLPASIASNFKFSSLKSRIVMMNKSKTSRFQLVKFMLLVPVVIVLLLAFRNGAGQPERAIPQAKTATESYTLSTLTYSIDDATVKSIVLKEQAGSFLKPGELLNLALIHNEKDRLKSLLEKNGYRNLRTNAIGFMIDTASVNNSFTVEIKINVEPAVVSRRRQVIGSSFFAQTTFTEQVIIPMQNLSSYTAFAPTVQADVLGIYTFLNVGKAETGC